MLLFITAVICLSNISSGKSKSDCCNKDGNKVTEKGSTLKINLQNGSKYVFDDVNVVESSRDGENYSLELEDGSTIDVMENQIEVRFNDNENFKINNVSKATKDGNNVIFDLENGEKLVVKDAANYEDLGNGVYSLGTNEGTEMKTKPKRRNSELDKNEESSEKNSSMPLAFSVLLLGFTSAIVLI